MSAAADARNEAELVRIREIAESGADRPVLMMNLNLYRADAGYPDGAPYTDYMRALEALLPRVGAKILWRAPVEGQARGTQNLHEILAVWYPSHRAFLDMPATEGADENYRLRGRCIESAVIHRCPGEIAPLEGT